MSTKEEPKPKKKIGIYILWTFLILTAAVLVIACVYAGKIFDDVKIDLDHNYVSGDPQRAAFVPFTVVQKGQQNLDIMRRCTPMTISKIQYSDDEFNHLIKTMIFSNLLSTNVNGQRVTAKRTSLILTKGVFRLKHIIDTPDNPFGKYLNLTVEFKISVENGVEKLEVISAKAGSYEIPNSMAQKKMDEMIAKYYTGTAQQEMIRNSVTRMYVDEKGFFLEYRPYPLVMDIDKIYFGGSGEFLRKIGHASRVR